MNPTPVPISVFDGWEPDEETLAIDVSWAPRVLAFPSHTYALALYFKRYQGATPPEHHLRQPKTGGAVMIGGDSVEIFEIPYPQPMLDDGIWMVSVGDGAEPVPVIWDRGIWRAAW